MGDAGKRPGRNLCQGLLGEPFWRFSYLKSHPSVDVGFTWGIRYRSPHKNLEIVASESGLEYFSMLASKSDPREVPH